ncbi:MAG: DNA topoisomerase 3 [Myxococcota bacterium]
MRVIVAEKPSVARDIARVLGATRRAPGALEGSGVLVTWCHGHMAELEDPAFYQEHWQKWSLATLPMLPERFAVRVRKDASDQLAVLTKWLNDERTVDVVNACDAGREGELIFRYVYEIARCKRPVLRLWTSSLTDAAIQQAWSRLRPAADFDRLADAARSRAEADWLVGLNATRALTCRARDVGGSGLFPVGRVQTPTLAMIVARDREIESFVPEDYWQVKATFTGQGNSEVEEADHAPGRVGGTWRATYFLPATKESEQSEGRRQPVPQAERIANEALAQAIASAADGQRGTVEEAERRRTTEPPPLLYDLTSLQRRANQRYGLSAQQTLTIAQALYEQHKLITYPRTDARYLTPAEVPLLPGVLAGLQPLPPYTGFVAARLAAGPLNPGSRVVNAAEVGDHHAIIPTGRTPSSSGLSVDEKRIFDLVARRLLAALSEDALFDVTRLVVAVPPNPNVALDEEVTRPLRFRARGRVCRREGWRAIDPPGPSKEVDLPAVEPDDRADSSEPEAKKGQTRPPRPHNDATLLRSMETAGRQLDDDALMRALRGKGLGTPATRASILQTLVDRKFVRRAGRDLHATDAGVALIDAVCVDALKSAELTGDWEGRLSTMSEGDGPSRADFMDAVRRYVSEIVQALIDGDPPAVDPSQAGPSLGDCPACGSPVRHRGRVWSCDRGRACSFVVFETMSRRKISKTMVQQLLRDGRSKPVKGFKKKRDGSPFTAGITWDNDDQRVRFWFPDAEARESRAPVRVGQPCPKCRQGTVIRGKRALGCSRWREGCSFRTDARERAT